jgi:hypothetical protein
MKRLVIGGAVAALIAGGAGISFADPGGGGGGGFGFNGNNNYGLCTAWLAHDKNGGNQPGPFAGLTPPEGSGYDSDQIKEYCQDLVANSGPGNSNGSHTNNGGGHGNG